MLRSATGSDKPVIPDEMLAKWQRVVDILARIAEVPAGLIMKREPPRHHVFITSATEGNSYSTDVSFELNCGLHCDKVMDERSLLAMPDAEADPAWNRNPDLKHGMVFYMGFPLVWPLFWYLARRGDKPANIDRWTVSLPCMAFAAVWAGERFRLLLTL